MNINPHGSAQGIIMLLELSRVILCLALGEILHRSGVVPVTGAVLGLLLLYANLLYLQRVPKELGALADRVLQQFGMLFVPAGVGIITQLGVFDDHIMAILAAVLVGSSVTIAMTALVADRLAQAL
ncbi:MAG: CidA/LrgA family protein, partial [Oxalobacteraceae bacterium]